MKETTTTWKQNKIVKSLSNLIFPIVAVIFSMVVGSVFMLIINANPILAYKTLFVSSFGSWYNFSEMLVNTIPLIFTGLSVAFAFRCGLFSIGGEGQYLVAYLATAGVGAYLHLPMIIHIPLCILAAMLAGALWGSVPGLLKAKWGIHEVISTIMFNYIALYTVDLLIRTVMKSEGILPATPMIEMTARLPRFPFSGRLTPAIFLALAAALVIYWILWKTTIGYEVRAVGFNPSAAEYGGINVARNIVLAMAVSGALAGLASVSQVMGLEYRAYQPFGLMGLGATGITVALLGKNHPGGVVLAAALFGMLQRGANMMQSVAGVPKEVIMIIQAIIIFFIASDYVVRKLMQRANANKVAAQKGVVGA